ncbi:MAG: T9SS type A sorting domain-containing protein [Flavobacterium sp.]
MKKNYNYLVCDREVSPTINQQFATFHSLQKATRFSKWVFSLLLITIFSLPNSTFGNNSTLGEKETAKNAYATNVVSSESSAIITSTLSEDSYLVNRYGSELLLTTWYQDADSDGFGNAAVSIAASTAPAGYVSNSTDCDDSNAAVWRSGYFFVDNDGDGYTTNYVNVCYGASVPVGYSASSLGADCNDSDATVWKTTLAFVDLDGDGFHGEVIPNYCYGATLPQYYTTTTLGFDCDDNNAAINPAAAEVPDNGIDENCNGMEDDYGTGQTTMIRNNQCGTTLPYIYSAIYANDNIANVTLYTFKVVDPNNMVQIISRTTNNFQIISLANYAYNTAYSISVGVHVGGVWQGYGMACTVTTPSIDRFLTIKECGMTRNIYSPISANVVPGATGYKFKITNVTNPGGSNGVMEIETTVSWFHLTSLPSYEYGTTYSVQVAVKTSGDYTDYGIACDISTIPWENLAIGIKQCGLTYTNIYSPINARVIPNVSGYRFRVTNMSTMVSEEIVPANSWINLSQLTMYAANTVYSVEVAVKTSGDFGPYGPACNITSPAAQSGNRVMAAEALAISAYPNPFSEVFSLNIARGTEGLVDVQVYDMVGKLLESKSVYANEISSLQLGSRFPAGIYNVVITHEQNVQTLRVIKR